MDPNEEIEENQKRKKKMDQPVEYEEK